MRNRHRVGQTGIGTAQFWGNVGVQCAKAFDV